jgi:guanylate kinase
VPGGQGPAAAGSLSAITHAWTAPSRGALFVVSGASGSGKTTLLREAFRVVPGLEFSVSVTTRAMRPGERDGVDYHFITQVAYDDLLARNALLEHAQVYDRAYGTPREPVERALFEGRSIVLDIDVQGAAQVRRTHPEALSLFILPPSRQAMVDRLRARGDAEPIVQRRMAQATEQLSAAKEYDYLVLNDDLAAAHAQFQAVLVAELLRRSRRQAWIDRVVEAARVRADAAHEAPSSS